MEPVSRQRNPVPAPVSTYDVDIGLEAEALYGSGMNVFPIPYGSKAPYGPHGVFNTTRLPRKSLSLLFHGSNIAVKTGHTSQNFFAIDCDSHEAFESIGYELSERGIKAWIRSSTRGGQYWLLCSEGEVANTTLQNIDILGNRLYTVAPPSLHPDGSIYRWDSKEGSHPPVVSLRQIDFLPLTLENVNSKRSKEKHGALPFVANQVLIERNIAGYPSNSEAEYAACVALARLAWTDANIIALFQSCSPPHFSSNGVLHFQKYTLNSARAYMAGSSGKQRDSGDHNIASAYLEWANDQLWLGRIGITNKSVYIALCERLRMEGRMPFRASAREVALLAGVTLETASIAIRRLETSGLLSTEGHDKSSSAYCYNMPPIPTPPTSVIRTLGGTPKTVGYSVRITDISHDVWHDRALGKSGWNCWTRLLEEPGLTVPNLMARLGYSRTTVNRALAKLRLHGAVCPFVSGGWEAVELSGSEFDGIARHYRKSGVLEKRRTTYQAERENRAMELITRQKSRFLSSKTSGHYAHGQQDK